MKFRGVILLLGSMWFAAVLLAQNSGSDELALRSLGGQAGTQQAQAASACSAASECANPSIEHARRPNRKPILRPIRPPPNLKRRNPSASSKASR